MDEFETTDETWRVAINADGEFILAFTGDTYYDRYYLDIYAHVYAQPPEGTIIEPLPNSVLSTADVPICLQLEDPDGVNSSSITISVDAVDLETTWDAGTHRANALATNLTSGIHQIEAQAYDLKGHGPMVLQWSFSLDFEPPFVRILEPSTLDWIPDSRITIIWESGDTTSGIAGQKMRIDSGDWISIGPNATQHAFTPTPEGHHNVTIQVEDFAGWVSEDSVHFKNDGGGPELLFTSPLDNPLLESGPVVVSWIASDPTSGLAGFAISVDNGSFVFVGLNTSVTVGDLGEGGHSFRVRAVDWAGNVVESTTYVTIGSPESHIPTVILILLFALLAIVVALCVAILILIWYFKWRNL
jgi:hypothetical protein